MTIRRGEIRSSDDSIIHCNCVDCVLENKVKSRKYQGVFEVKSRVKTWQVRGRCVYNIMCVS